MSPELLYVRNQRLSGSEVKAAMDRAGISMKEAADLFGVSLKTMYNLINSERLRGPYRWAAYAIFPTLRPVFVTPEAEGA